MEVIKQYIVYDKGAGAYHILYETANGYYRSSTGAFNQRDMFIARVEKEEAMSLIADTLEKLTSD